MPLLPERRKQLDDIVIKMSSQNAPKKDVDFIVNDFIAKFGNEQEKPQESKPQGIADKFGNLPVVKQVKAFGDFQTNLAKGAAKGVASTAKGIGLGTANLLGKATNAITGSDRYQSITNEQFQKNTAEMGGIARPFNPTRGTAQKVGFGAEQIGEFFVPEGAVAKGAKVAEGAKLLTQTPKLAKAVGFGAKVAGEAAGAGGITALQGGDQAQTKSAMILSAAFPVLGKTASKLGNTKVGQSVARYLVEKIPSRMINTLIKPREAAFSFGKNPGLAVAEEGITANTRGGLLQRITKKKQQIGQAIEQELIHPDVAEKIIDVTPAIQTLDSTIQKAAKTGDQGLVRRLLDIKKSLTKEFELVGDELVEKGVRNTQLTPLEAQQLKREIGEATRWTGQAFDADANKARVSIYRAIDSLIDDAVPSVSKLNNRYANMLTAEKELLRTNKNLQRLAAIGLKQGGIGVGYGLYSGLSGDSTGEAVAKGLGAAVLAKGLGSTAVKTRVAKQSIKIPARVGAIGKKSGILLKSYLGGREKRNNNNTK